MRKISFTEKYLSTLFICLLIVFGFFYIRYSWKNAESRQSENIILLAHSFEAFLPKQELLKLNALPEDSLKPEYAVVKNHLHEMTSIHRKIRFAYVWIEKNGKLFFIADSEPINSKNYSPPGQEYTEAKPDDKKPFIDGKDYITPALTDRWGTWRSVYVPIKDKTTGKTIAVLGLDFDADSWEDNILSNVTRSVLLIVLIIILALIIFNIYVKNKSLKEIIKYRQNAESELIKSEQKFRNLVEASSDIIWETNLEGKYTYVSPQVESIIGYKPTELIGKSPFDNMSEDESERVKKLSDAIIISKKSFNSLENIIIHKNGEKIYLETSGIPILDEENNLLGYRGVDRNFTERKKAEERLKEHSKEIEKTNSDLESSKIALLGMMEEMKREILERKKAEDLLNVSNSKLKTILEVAGEGIIGVSTEGSITFANPMAAKLLGYEIAEMLDKNSHLLFHHTYPDGRPFPGEECPNYMTLKKGKHIAGEDYYWKKDGTGFHVAFSSSPIYENNIVSGLVITFIDINSRKQFEKEIKAKTDELERFNKLLVNREIKMIELKKEINELLKKSGESEKYRNKMD